MSRAQKAKDFKNNLMGYLHGHDPNYEPALRFLLENEHEIYEELAKKDNKFHYGDRNEKSWPQVFKELTKVMAPHQIQLLFELLAAEFQETADLMKEMAEAEKLLQPEIGTGD